MKLFEDIQNKKEKISVTGLGYVGLPIALAFAERTDVIGFDISQDKINQYLNGIDVTQEAGDKAVSESTILFTSEEKYLMEAKFHIVTVPTPINSDKTPNLTPVIEASKMIGRNLQYGAIVVYESTVYPGVTEDVCIPILEESSGLKCGVGFKVGYSPERINPGDKDNKLQNIVKVVSGMDEGSLEIIAQVYEMIIDAGVYKAESIKVAEASKVIENAQRDINIAFMNELSIVFNKMEIDTIEVLRAAGTKWNFLNFTPGLVGGHCIGVDPYYFVYRAEDLGYHSQIILSGRRINDEMGKYVAENTVKQLIKSGKQVKGANVAIFGITFKENVPDSRNTKVVDIIKELEDYEVNINVIDPVADAGEVQKEYNIDIKGLEDLENVDAVIFAVPHKEFFNISLESLKKLYKTKQVTDSTINSERLIQEQETYPLIDIKGFFDKKEALKMNYAYWRL